MSRIIKCLFLNNGTYYDLDFECVEEIFFKPNIKIYVIDLGDELLEVREANVTAVSYLKDGDTHPKQVKGYRV